MNIIEETLSNTTQKYLKNKYVGKNEEVMEKMDLRLMCENVRQELQDLEHDTAFDYLKVESQILQLNKKVDQSDQILEELEEILTGF